MKVFVSHSRRDERILKDLADAMPVLGIHDSVLYEQLPPEDTSPDAERIRELIRESDALLILQTQTTESLAHTKDWIAYECALAAAFDVPIVLVRDRHLPATACFPLVTDYAEVDFEAPRSITTIQQALLHHKDRPFLSYPLPRTAAFAAGGSIFGPVGLVAGGLLAILTQPKTPSKFQHYTCPSCRRPLRLWSAASRCPSCAHSTTDLVAKDDATHH